MTARAAAAAMLAGVLALTGCGSGTSGSAEVSQGHHGASASMKANATTTTSPPQGLPAAATTPEGLAAQLTQVETAIRNPATPATDLPRLGHTEQIATAALASHPEWQEQVLAALPATVRPIVDANVLAASELRRLSSSEPRDIPKWQIVTPPPAADLLREYKGAEAAIGVPWQYLAAIHLVESRMGRIRGDSSAGAQGPMQFLPSTWAAYGAGGDINSYHDSIAAAARYLKANGAPDNMDNALYRYNPSNRYVRAIQAYAGQMSNDERAYYGYYYWQVYYFSTHLPEGYGS